MAHEGLVGRLTPYEVVFGAGADWERAFAVIEREAAERGLDVRRRDLFVRLDAAIELLEQLAPEDSAPAEFDRFLGVLFHCFNFWRSGRAVTAFEPAVVRDLVAAPPELGGWQVAGEPSSLYVELPLNLFWATVLEEGTPEPVEGLFAKLWKGEAGGRLDLLIVLGARPDRAGFSVVEVSVDLAEVVVLEESPPFRSEIPGAELAGLYSLQQSSDAVLLVQRLLWYLETYPEAIEQVPGSESAEPRASSHSAPTALDHRRVRLVERSRG